VADVVWTQQYVDAATLLPRGDAAGGCCWLHNGAAIRMQAR
jgi:hypothetical protein